MRVVAFTTHGDVPLQAPFFLELRSEVRPHGERIDVASLLHQWQAKAVAPSSRQSGKPTVKSRGQSAKGFSRNDIRFLQNERYIALQCDMPSARYALEGECVSVYSLRSDNGITSFHQSGTPNIISTEGMNRLWKNCNNASPSSIPYIHKNKHLLGAYFLFVLPTI